MIKEFCSLSGAEEGGIGESWSKYMAAVFKYAPLETKKVVKTSFGAVPVGGRR